MTITTIAFDGDDTLWHHENYFAIAREQFQTLMNEIGPYPDASAQADQQHINNLPFWGYGVRSYTLSMIEAAISMTNGTITGTQTKQVMDIGRSLYQHPIILLDHVAETIQALHSKYRLVLITKGDLVAQEMKVHQSKLGPFFESVEIVSEKDIPTYERVFKRLGVKPTECVMVGNSVKSDIIPPLALGAKAIHIPYSMTWMHEQVEITETDHGKFLTMPSIQGLPEAVPMLEMAGQAKVL